MSKCIYTQEQFDKILEERNELANENFKLKQQLVEKDKELLDVKNWWSYQYEGEKQRHHQDKISFAVEQLEKVKEFNHSLVLGGNYKLDEFIDNQIEELKKEMK